MLTRYINSENESPAFVIHNALSLEKCDEIIEKHKDTLQPAIHDSGKGELVNDKKIRSSQITWLNDTQINFQLNELMTIANGATGWNYDITAHEQHQFTKYGPEDHYSWHYDGSGCHFAKRHFTFDSPSSLTETNIPSCINTVRKISASVLLNDDFSGGDFDIAFLEKGNAVKKSIKPQKGDIIFFPSHLQHRVRPVRVGTRYSLVCWFAGPPFK
jgi:PKHD-type hydroxylase|tara:strand:- start:1309 stop:1953 length:645 start_codon:yes stop_codon:yes gene_type:complete